MKIILILNKILCYLKTIDKKYGGVEWFDIASLPKLAYDHSDVVTLAKERLETKLEYTNIVCNLLPREFSLSEMQKAYEIILDRKLDKRNFQKKYCHLL